MKPYKTIGIGVTFSPNLSANIAEATRLASASSCKLILIHVGEFSEEKDKKFRTCIKDYSDNNGLFEIVYKNGNPVDVILQTVKDQNIDLLVLGALKREKFVKFYLGSIARKITRKATCSVLLLINPSIERVTCKHIVVNGLEDPKTEETISTACYFGHILGSQEITIVEEIGREEIGVKIDDDKTLQMANLMKERRSNIENERVNSILKDIPEEYIKDKKICTQPIFGKRGYSISHYSEVVRADLLVMNATPKSTIWDIIFPHDIEYILSELPTDVLIVQ